MISRIDEQPTSLSESLFRFRTFFKDRRSGRDRRRGSTMIDPGLDRRKGERRKNRTRENENS
jgi:hypothetical protein